MSRKAIAGEQPAVDVDSLLTYLEAEHKVLKILLSRRVEVSKRCIHVQRETRQMVIDKVDGSGGGGDTKQQRSSTLDLRYIKDVHTLDYKLNKMRINESKWRQRELLYYDPKKVMLIYHGSEFVLNVSVFAFEKSSDCDCWVSGLQYLREETASTPHPLIIERWLRKEFYSLCEPPSLTISVKVLKLFIQQRLQCKISSKGLQELVNVSFDLRLML
ncbi:unnamed protein product [Soboliphyme baturini]|uniref:PH domain-containing protein n=1 Tax=Soboliphyme baturini TaxID=241478 RepID=A0A183I8U6_9BILA|nr:unnamed protein product [Soboliphyme baturini]